jgi:hypothetical protein
MTQPESKDHFVLVHTAGTLAEAMVIRSVLQSEGIQSPGSVTTDPFPLRDVPEGTHGVEIYAPASQAREAELAIQAHLRAGAKETREDEKPGG